MKFSTSVLLAFVMVFVSALPLKTLNAQDSKPYKLTKLDKEYLDQAEKTDRSLEKRGMIYAESEVTGYLTEIVQRLAAPIKMDDFVKLEVKIYRDSLENAFALGNGSIYVSVGLISRMETENQMASVLAHELAHVKLRHPMEGYKDYVTNATIANVAVIITAVPAEGNALFHLAVNGYSREQEQEADLYALSILKNAGYDPSSLENALVVMETSYEGDPDKDPPIFWRDHPKTEKRKEYLKQAVEQDFAETKGDPRYDDESAYLARTVKIRHKGCSLNVHDQRFATACAIADDTLESIPSDPESLVDKGVAVREWAIWAEKAKEDYEKEPEVKMCGPDPCKYQKEEEEKGPPKLISEAPQLKDAEKYLEEAISIDPKLPRAHRELGELYMKMGEKEKAVEQFQMYLELAPKSRDRIKVRRKIESLAKSDSAEVKDGEKSTEEEE